MSDARARLEEELEGSLPPGLAGLSEAELETLAEAILAARTRQAEALRRATAHGLDFVPRLLRGPVRKVLFG